MPKRAFPDRQVISKAERRLRKTAKQRARIKADPQREVAREQRRVERARTEPAGMTVHKRELYRSAPNGDRWSLAREDHSGRVFIEHEPNASSGGRTTQIEIGDFLAHDRGGPEHPALVRLIGTLVD
jgi:hypothetical protein